MNVVGTALFLLLVGTSAAARAAEVPRLAGAALQRPPATAPGQDATQKPPDAKQRAFKVEAKPEETLTKEAGIKDRYALLIGITRYANPDLNLAYAAADAQALAKVLTDPEVGAYKPENVRVLLDDQATRKNIVSALNTWLKNRVTPDDSVIIFYSGHGALGAGSEAYWVTYDADAEDLAASAISNKEISSAIGGLAARRKVTLIDSCFSEATAKKYRAVVPNNVFDEFKGTGVVTMTASTGAQKSVEVNGHGAFTFHLLDALQGKADANNNGVVELDEIWTYLNERVQRTAADAGNRQTPVLMAERLEHGFPVTVNPLQSGQRVLAGLKTMYNDSQITVEEMSEAERAFTERDGNPELRKLFKGLADKELSVPYFRRLKTLILAGGAGTTISPTAAPRSGTDAPAAPPPAAPPVGRAGGTEVDSFNAAKAAGTFDGWLRFLQQFPASSLAAAARTQIDDLDRRKAEQAAYDLARQADHEKTWQQFVTLYPNGAHFVEADRRVSELRSKREAELAAFRLAESKNVESAWKRYLEEYRSGLFYALAEDHLAALQRVAREREESAWAQAQRKNTLDDWDRFTTEYPAGRFSAEAVQRREELSKRLQADEAARVESELYSAARKGDAVAGWEAYAAKYASGPHYEEARVRIAQLRWIEFADVVAVPGGTFSMGTDNRGDTRPPHQVELDPFLIGRAEVTNAQYLKFLGETDHARPSDPSFVKNYANAYPDLPVLRVTYADALAFCQWLSERTGAQVRLPTEAEFEYAATGGGKPGMLYPWGKDKPKVRARYEDNAPPGQKMATAKEFPPSPGLGLLNVAGNAAEWIMDWYEEDYYSTSPVKNPRGPATGKDRGVRGGSWKSSEDELLVSARDKRNPQTAADDVGFRVVIEAPRK
jgi:formylglycine-generating enzyme required for sulfatase activity